MEDDESAARGRYELYRAAIASEATWSAQRTTWLVTANAFLAAALATMGDTESSVLQPGARMMRSLLPAGAITINVGTLVMLLAAEWVTIVRVREYGKTPRGVPDLLGTLLAHVVGALVPVLIGLVLIYGWVRIASA